MKQETTQKTKLNVFLDKVGDFYEGCKIWIFIILYLISTSISALFLYSLEFYEPIVYPEEEYQQLEEQELPNLVKNGRIQVENLSENTICSIEIECVTNQDKNYTFILEKENAKITVTGKDLNLKELTIIRDEENNEYYYGIQQLVKICFTLLCGLFLGTVIFVTILAIIVILLGIVKIQKISLRRKQRK